MAKTYTDWGDKAKHSISFAQHKKNVAKAGGSGGGGAGKLPDAARVTARAKKDPAFLARALKNPGLRSKITDISLLPRDLQQERTLNAPIVAGSTMTGRDLRRQSTAEVATDYAIPESEYAQQLKAAQQHQGDVGGWYDQYQAQIAAASQRIGQAQDQAVAGTQAMSGVGAQQAGQLAGQAAAAVAPGTTVAADIAQSAGQGTAARENLVSSYVGQAQQQAGTQKALGNWMTGVVAPGQKVQALTTAQRAIDTVRDKQSALAVKKGAELLKTRADIRQQEIANTVALKQLGNQTLTAKTNAAANTPAAKTAAAGATAGIDVDKSNAVKAGVSLKTWQAMTPAQQAKAIKAMNPDKKDPNKLDAAITDPKDPFFGLTPRQIARHSQTWRDQRITHAYDLTHPGKDKPAKKTADAFKAKYNVNLATGSVHKTLTNDVATARTYVKQLTSIKGDKGQTMTDAQIQNLLLQGGTLGSGTNKYKVPRQDNALAVRMAIELERRHGITGGTADMAHRSGYSISQLGYPSVSSGSTTTLVHPKKPATYGSRQDTAR